MCVSFVQWIFFCVSFFFIYRRLAAARRPLQLLRLEGAGIHRDPSTWRKHKWRPLIGRRRKNIGRKHAQTCESINGVRGSQAAPYQRSSYDPSLLIPWQHIRFTIKVIPGNVSYKDCPAENWTIGWFGSSADSFRCVTTALAPRFRLPPVRGAWICQQLNECALLIRAQSAGGH